MWLTYFGNPTQQRSAARADAEGDHEDDMKAQEDQEFLETLQESKERSGSKETWQ